MEVGDVWELFAEDGQMKMYKREEEVDGMVMDPLKALHEVRGKDIFERSLQKYLWQLRLRLKIFRTDVIIYNFRSHWVDNSKVRIFIV